MLFAMNVLNNYILQSVLKKVEIPINCLECGHWFFKGVDITE